MNPLKVAAAKKGWETRRARQKQREEEEEAAAAAAAAEDAGMNPQEDASPGQAAGGPAIQKGNGFKMRTRRTGCIGHPRCARVVSGGTRYCSCINQYRRDLRLSSGRTTTTASARSYQQPPRTAEEWSLAFCRKHPFCALMRPVAAASTQNAKRRRKRRCSCHHYVPDYLAAATPAVAGGSDSASRCTALSKAAASSSSRYSRWRQVSGEGK